MTTRIYLIRHGETEHSAADRLSGASDIDLAAEGRRQASCLAQRLARQPIAALYSSPLRRTVETATLVGRPHGLTPILAAGLREIDYGQWEARRRRDVQAEYAAAFAAWEADPLTLAPPGGETGRAVLARALPALQSIAANHPTQTIAVVSHKTTIRLMLCGLLGIDPRGYRARLDQSPACLNILDWDETHGARLILFNDVSHYESGPTAGSLAV